MRCISILLFVLSINFQGASVRAGDDKPGSIADLRDWCDDKGGSYFRQGAGIPARCDFQDNRSFTQVPQEKPVITEKKVDYFTWCKSQKNAFWDGRSQRCDCDVNGKDVECHPDNQASTKSLEDALGIPQDKPVELENYRGCAFASPFATNGPYSILQLNKEAQKKCRCEAKVPTICYAELDCDGSDKETDPSQHIGKESMTVKCKQIDGKCPSLETCFKDSSLDGMSDQKLNNLYTPGSAISK